MRLSKSIATLLLLLAGFSTAIPPSCEQDGTFEDDEDCSSFYDCQGGSFTQRACPFGLFFNNDTSLCDWAQSVGCELTIAQMEMLTLPKPIYLYLTLDDSPGGGTDETLDALANEGIRTTFFLNSVNLESGDTNGMEMQIMRMLAEGHVLADHSYDHMAHNYANGLGPYQDVEEDERYFGDMSWAPIAAILARDGVSQPEIDRLSGTFHSYARQPFSNNWRIQGRVRHDCLDCTVPPTSAYYGMKVADRLAERAINVIGWDFEWYTDWGPYRYMKGAVGLLMEMLEWSTAEERKLVLLTHSFMQDPALPHGGYNLEEFRLFLRLAKSIGFEFRTIDTYLEDRP